MDPTAAPTDLQLNGTTYKAYPFRDIDHEEMNKWVRREYLRRVRDAIGDDPELQTSALNTIATMQWMFGEGLRVAMSAKGVHRIANLMCRDSKIPEESCKGSDVLEHVMEVFKELHPVEETKGSGSGEGSEVPK